MQRTHHSSTGSVPPQLEQSVSSGGVAQPSGASVASSQQDGG